MKHHKPVQLGRSLLAVVGVALFSLAQFVPSIVSGTNAKILAAPPPDVCLTLAVAQIGSVHYQGKNAAGQDGVEVDWLAQSGSDCVVFGSGHDVDASKTDIPNFGYEVTVKIKRRLGHEDSGTFKTGILVKGDVKTFVKIPRGNLETDPVSFEATVKTTAGAVLRKTSHVIGTGTPTLAGATQTFTKNSTVLMPDGCYPSLQVSAINFIPGSGSTPDKVTINWGAGTPLLACFDPPRVSILFRATRPGGHVDTAQANFDPGATTATLSLPGAPGAVASFDVFVTAISGAVLDKTNTKSGNF
jgi:hypothetical protein